MTFGFNVSKAEVVKLVTSENGPNGPTTSRRATKVKRKKRLGDGNFEEILLLVISGTSYGDLAVRQHHRQVNDDQQKEDKSWKLRAERFVQKAETLWFRRSNSVTPDGLRWRDRPGQEGRNPAFSSHLKKCVLFRVQSSIRGLDGHKRVNVGVSAYGCEREETAEWSPHRSHQLSEPFSFRHIVDIIVDLCNVLYYGRKCVVHMFEYEVLWKYQICRLLFFRNGSTVGPCKNGVYKL